MNICKILKKLSPNKYKKQSKDKDYKYQNMTRIKSSF